MQKFVSLLAFFLCFFSIHVQAQNLSIRTDVNLESFYDDRFARLIDDSKTGAIIYRPNIAVDYQAQRWASSVNFNAEINEFLEDEFNDSKNSGVSWNLAGTQEKSSWQIDAGYSERLIADVEELDGIGLSGGGNTFERITFSPSYSRSISSRNSLDFAYYYQQTQTSASSDVDQQENESHGANLGVSTNLSQRSVLQVSVSHILFTSDTSEDSQSSSILFGGDFKYSEKWVLAGSIGAAQFSRDSNEATIVVAEEENEIKDNQILLNADVTANFTGEKDLASFTLASGALQQLDGRVVERQAVSVSWERTISAKLTTVVDLSYLLSENAERQEYNIQTRASWRLSPSLDLTLGYRYRDSQFSSIQGFVGGGNRFTLSFDYALEELRF